MENKYVSHGSQIAVIESIREPFIITENVTNPNPYWFIKWFKGQPIITLHDFKALTGLNLTGMKPFFRLEYFTPGVDWNGLGQGPLREEFERVNDVHYEEETFMYMYASGVRKALSILSNDRKINMNQNTIGSQSNKDQNQGRMNQF